MPVYQCGSARVSPPRVALCLPTSHRRRAPRSPSSSSFFLLSRLRSHTDTSAESAQDEAPDSKDDPSGAPESQTNPPFVCTPVPHTEDTSFPPSSRGRPIKHPAIRPRRARSAHQAVPHARGTKDVQPEAFLQLASVPFPSLSLSLHLSLPLTLPSRLKTTCWASFPPRVPPSRHIPLVVLLHSAAHLGSRRRCATSSSCAAAPSRGPSSCRYSH